MAKRNEGNRNKAEGDTRGLGGGGDRGDRGKSGTGGVVGQTTDSGKTLQQLTAERMAESRFTDMMASAGVGTDSMALEVLYWMPRDFQDAYQEVYMGALKDTDGGAGGKGKTADAMGKLGKAAAAKTTGKKYKKYWVIQDEELLELKTRIDKRLRGLAREIRGELDQRQVFGKVTDKEVGQGVGEVAERRAEELRRELRREAQAEEGMGELGELKRELRGEAAEETAPRLGRRLPGARLGLRMRLEGEQLGLDGRLQGGRKRCEECGIMVGPAWRYCCKCGLPLLHLEDLKSRKG